MRHQLIIIASFFIATSYSIVSNAATITVGKGTGVIWEGFPFNVTLSGPLNNSGSSPSYGLMSITNKDSQCLASTSLTTIGGIKAYSLGQGLGLVPRAIGSATYTAYDGSTRSFPGTIGLPETRGGNSGELVPSSAFDWCLAATSVGTPNFYSASGPRTVNISGLWAIVSDGTQRTSQFSVPVMYASSFSIVKTGDRVQSILPDFLTIRVSALECSVNTPTVINFGTVSRNLITNSELSQQSNPFVVNCSQTSDYITANIAVQFRALTSLYGGVKNNLSLEQGGGYITGEISNITGSGTCGSNAGISYDSTPINIGKIGLDETSKSFNNQIIWRLCSGGNILPTGPVSASTEMLVTFN